MKKEVLLSRVKEEATILRAVLTADQKAKMDYETLNPQIATLCLFGQIFGSYKAPEAIEVLPKSIYSRVPSLDLFEAWSFEKNNKYRMDFNRFELVKEKREGVEYNHFTHLEVFLMCETNSEDMFKYIKGEIEDFEPSFLEVAETV
jgi:hypothetical protein